MTAKKLIGLEAIVKPILEEKPETRNDDFELYLAICEKYCGRICIEKFWWVLKHHKELGLPNYESVTRVRRKLQEKYPELESERAKERRRKQQAEYVEYARTS